MYLSPITSDELYELLASALALAYAFYIAVYKTLILNPVLYLILLLLAIVSFIPHELAHRFMANRYGYLAKYRMWIWGLLLAIATAFLGFIFAAPGAVYIIPTPEARRREAWKIAFVGPLVNAIIGTIAYLLALYAGASTLLGVLLLALAKINIYLAFFNSLPIPPLDGLEVASERPGIYVIWMAALVGLMVLAGMI